MHQLNFQRYMKCEKRQEMLLHLATSGQMSKCLCAAVPAKNFVSAHLAPRSAIYREGFCQKCWPGGQKSAISEKEIAVFELRKVLFPEKHLQELLRAYQGPPWAHSA